MVCLKCPTQVRTFWKSEPGKHIYFKLHKIAMKKGFGKQVDGMRRGGPEENQNKAEIKRGSVGHSEHENTNQNPVRIPAEALNSYVRRGQGVHSIIPSHSVIPHIDESLS
jgi:hypothetical protein